jgi:hypothetical protein
LCRPGVDGRIAWEPFPALSLAEQDEPVAWLWSVLQEGELRSSYIQRQAKKYGISAKMLRRARRVLKVEICREGRREESASIWCLPGTTPPVRRDQVVRATTSAEPAGHLSGPISAEAPLPTLETGQI